MQGLPDSSTSFKPAARVNTTLHPSKDSSWYGVLAQEMEKPYYQELRQFVASEYGSGKAIYPPRERVFAAFDLTPFDAVQVIILGQDPYHGEGQAQGLAFSVGAGVRLPPSLRNIFKEYVQDLDLPMPQSGDLSSWAERGILLLNTVLTVEDGRPASHAKRGWEKLTACAVKALAEKRQHLAFILWGDKAQAQAQYIDPKRHLIVSSPHPSPLSAHRGFFGSRPFSQVNNYRKALGMPAIDWRLS